jgi:hypothetical protein
VLHEDEAIQELQALLPEEKKTEYFEQLNFHDLCKKQTPSVNKDKLEKTEIKLRL